MKGFPYSNSPRLWCCVCYNAPMSRTLNGFPVCHAKDCWDELARLIIGKPIGKSKELAP